MFQVLVTNYNNDSLSARHSLSMQFLVYTCPALPQVQVASSSSANGTDSIVSNITSE